MDKLDENYLDLVRESLYRKPHNISTQYSVISSKNPKKPKHKVGDNEATPKNTVKQGFKTNKKTFKAKAKLQSKSKKKITPKEVRFVHKSEHTPENIPEKPFNKVKNRVATPFKNVGSPVKLKAKIRSEPNLNLSQGCEIVSTIAKKTSPSLHENDRLTFLVSHNKDNCSNLGEDGNNQNVNKNKSKKRLLSESDSPDVSRKRKKEKSSAKKGKKLEFDDSLDDSKIDEGISVSSEINHSNKVVLKRKKGHNKDKEKSLDTNFTLKTSWQDETEFNLNNTWENFIYSFKDDKDNEMTDKPRKKKIMNKNRKTNSNIDSSIDLQNSNNITNPASSHKITNLKLETSSGSIIVDKKSRYKNGKASGKVKKLKLKATSLKPKRQKNTESLGFIDSLDSSDSLSDIEFNPKETKKALHSNLEDLVECLDSCDSEAVGVQGLKFQRFCNLFPPTHNEQFVGHTSTLSIPKKYFKVSEHDLETDGECEEFPSLKHKEDRKLSGLTKSNISIDNVFENRGQDTTAHSQSKVFNHGDSPSKKQGPKKKINILDVKIWDSKLQDSNGIIRDQEKAEETSDSQDNLEEPENVIQSCEMLQSSPEKDNQISSKKFKKPRVIALKNGAKIIALNVGDIMHFHGLCQIKVLNGELEILGASINSTSGEKKLYSPRGTALLYIRNKSVLFVDNSVKLNDLVSEEWLYVSDVDFTLKQHYAIFLCTELKEPYMDFIERHISQKIFPDMDQELRVDFKLQGSWNRLQISENWEEVLENVFNDSKTVISGGKGVGKSTFLRFAVNLLLKRFDKIRILDLDPGQSEFYFPGCISVVTVDKDVFGPNYTHILEPVSSILSHINMGYDIKKYLKSVWYLQESTKCMEALPTIINFPGFTQGIGLDISAQSLSMIDPSLVIQINSKTHSKNYRIDMTAERVSRVLNENIILSQEESNSNLSYDFVKLESLAENNEAWSLEARQGREMNILSYFGRLMTDSINDLTSPEVNMYSIGISVLSITNSEGKTISPLTINANLVALCSVLDTTSNIFSCHGYGFVRGLDLQMDTLVLITSETIATLENVTHLVLSSVTIPPAVIMTASDVKGNIPYVCVGDPVDFGQFTKRSYVPPKK